MNARAVIKQIVETLIKIDTWAGVPTATRAPQTAPLPAHANYQYLNRYIPR